MVHCTLVLVEKNYTKEDWSLFQLVVKFPNQLSIIIGIKISGRISNISSNDLEAWTNSKLVESKGLGKIKDARLTHLCVAATQCLTVSCMSKHTQKLITFISHLSVEWRCLKPAYDSSFLENSACLKSRWDRDLPTHTIKKNVNL